VVVIALEDVSADLVADVVRFCGEKRFLLRREKLKVLPAGDRRG